LPKFSAAVYGRTSCNERRAADIVVVGTLLALICLLCANDAWQQLDKIALSSQQAS
jgi:hypothetical protein